MISKAIYEDCRRRNKNLSRAWIDYQKAFDGVPHSWVEKSIALVGMNSKIVRFCKLSMEKWITREFFKNKAGSNSHNRFRYEEECSNGTLFRHYSFAYY
jgi:hypothetical protein